MLAPTDIDKQNRVLWLDATADNCSLNAKQQVVHWEDHSDNDNHANSLDEDYAPTFVHGVLQGHAAVRFQNFLVNNQPDRATQLVVADASSLQFGTEDFVYLAVARWKNLVGARSNGGPAFYTGAGTLLYKQKNTIPYLGIELLANYPAPNYADANPCFAARLRQGDGLVLSSANHLNNDVFRLVAARRVGHKLSARVNGVESSAELDADFDVSAHGQDLYLGGYEAQPFVGDIAEVVAIRGHFSDDDLFALERYFAEKYALY